MEEAQRPRDNSEIGYVIGGGLKDNLIVRLTVPPQQVQEGAFVVVESGDWSFYGLVADLQLGASDPRFADEVRETRLPHPLGDLLFGEALFANVVVLPSLMLERGPELNTPEYDLWVKQDHAALPISIKTIPSHHAKVRLADAGDVAQIFGDPEKNPSFFPIGSTREQGHPVSIDLDKFVQRSAGIFGATGTGKSFLARIILAGLIKRDQASVLIFDMHNEYAYDDIAADTQERVFGLKSKFPSKVDVVSLGRTGSIRGLQPSFNLEIAESDITPQDVELLTAELNLRETTPTVLEALQAQYGGDWFHAFKNMKNGAKVEDANGKRVDAPESVAAWANEAGINVMSAEALHSKLGPLFHSPYIVEQPAADSLRQLIEDLEAGKHVVLSFGKYEKDLDYLLVSNLLTRRIREHWERKTDEFRSGEAKGQSPRPLVIVVEEAHKLLNPAMAAQTTFSTIAREMRKYFVTLLVIDQRPSQIYDEVISQIGTRIVCWLGDDQDIQAVLSGLGGKEMLRGMLARLQPKEEALLLGWGTPMPILVRSRRYDNEFWQELLPQDQALQTEDKIIKGLGF